MSLAEFSLQRPFTVAAGILLVCLLAVSAFSRMAMDIFPEINIPVIAVVWNYAGMSAPEMRDRIATLFQRQVAQEVDHVAHRSHQLHRRQRRESVPPRRCQYGACRD
jgi:multidrug efflux pump subunit AcrB